MDFSRRDRIVLLDWSHLEAFDGTHCSPECEHCAGISSPYVVLIVAYFLFYILEVSAMGKQHTLYVVEVNLLVCVVCSSSTVTFL